MLPFVRLQINYENLENRSTFSGGIMIALVCLSSSLAS
ncbi:NPH3 domain-containing protein [Psidium guajava]|nr:NPH3 domain-containing protein [Psidium guajava]